MTSAQRTTTLAADIAALKNLPRVLAREGYVDAYAIYGPLNLRVDLWAADLDLLPASLRVLVSAFLLGRSVARDELALVFSDQEIDALISLSILLPDGEKLHTGNMVLLPLLGFLVFAQRPGVNPIAYFGEDSAALALHLMPSRGDVCLDLCTGPGIQALVCSGRASRVVAVDVNPLAAAHAELNVVMNGLEDRVEIRTGDLFSAVPDLEFDFISANPPLLPFPPDLPYPFVGHGGADGLDITRRILKGLPAALKPGGVCQIIGTCTGDWDAPGCEAELRELAERTGLRIRMTIPSALPLVRGAHMFDGLAWTCAAAARLDVEPVKDALEAHLRTLGATHLYLFFLAISRDDRKPGLELTRHYEDHAGFWYISR
ncbi:MAG TPA: methyltransferase [Bryobacteraceae bacterium]|nr:methyltransferase [Bryobacteraceae bacterium]